MVCETPRSARKRVAFSSHLDSSAAVRTTAAVHGSSTARKGVYGGGRSHHGPDAAGCDVFVFVVFRCVLSLTHATVGPADDATRHVNDAASGRPANGFEFFCSFFVTTHAFSFVCFLVLRCVVCELDRLVHRSQPMGSPCHFPTKRTGMRVRQQKRREKRAERDEMRPNSSATNCTRHR